MPKLILVIPACTFLFLISSFCQAARQLDSDPNVVPEQSFEKAVFPLLERYCIQCHSPGDMQGLDFMAIESRKEALKHKGLFAAVHESISEGSMPPGNCDQPTEQERKLILSWIKKELNLKPEDTDRIASYVVETFQARDGSLWFGTMAKGAVRYDGAALTSFTKADGLPSNTVSSIIQDRKGTLWFGTHSGVAKYDGTAITIVGPDIGLPASKGGGPESSASVNTDREGNVWVSMGTQVFRQSGKKFIEFKLPSNSKPIDSFSILAGDASFKMEDRNGNLWFGRDGDGLYRYDGQSFEHYTKSDGLCSNNVNGIIEDRKGRIWITCMQSYQPKMTGDGGLCRFDGKSFLRFPNVKGLHNNDLYTIHQTNSGDIWIGASGVGAYRYDGQNFSLFNKTDRPHWTRNFGIQSILEDRNGTLWFGFSGGLFRFNGKSFFNVGSLAFN